MDGKVVPVDTAGLLWQCAAKHATDFLNGNYMPALIMYANQLNFLRSICRWRPCLYIDGKPNPNKSYEDVRREERRRNATDDYG